MTQTWNSPAFLPVEPTLGREAFDDAAEAPPSAPPSAHTDAARTTSDTGRERHPLADARAKGSANTAQAEAPHGATSSSILSNEHPTIDAVVEQRRPTPLVLVEELLREPGQFLHRLDRLGQPTRAERADRADARTPELARSLVAVVTLTGALFGAAIGMFRGGIQTFYCATKVPLVLLVTLAVSAPAFFGLARATRTDISPRGLVLLSLGACARFGLVLAGLAPVLWLLETSMGYHRMIIATVLACIVAGVTAGSLLFRGLARARGNGALAGVGAVLIFALVGGHASWMLRPFVVRPRTEHVPFLRPVESDLAASVATSTRSAAELYDTATKRVDPRRYEGNQAPSESWEHE